MNIFFSNRKSVESLFPKVYFINVNSHMNQSCSHRRSSLYKQLNLFEHWLYNNYEHRTDNGSEAELFFFPIDVLSCQRDAPATKVNLAFWYEADYILGNLSTRFNSFSLDKVFVSATHPGFVRRMTIMDPEVRNIHDIRFLRSDHLHTPNARDVLIPLVVNRSLVERRYTKSSYAEGLDGRRRFLFFLPAPPATMDDPRQWNKRLLDEVSKSSNYYVPPARTPGQSKTESLMMVYGGMQSSDFCFVLPEHTSSAAHLYSYLFTGCIPVIFVSFRGQLPFDGLIQWNKFSFVVLKDILLRPSLLRALLEELRGFRRDPARLTQMRFNAKAASRLLDYRQKTWPSVFHLTLLQLMLTSACAAPKYLAMRGADPEDYPGELQARRADPNICF